MRRRLEGEGEARDLEGSERERGGGRRDLKANRGEGRGGEEGGAKKGALVRSPSEEKGGRARARGKGGAGANGLRARAVFLSPRCG